MDYAALPPETSSALMYYGPGPGSMLTAAKSWDVVAAELVAAVQSYRSVISSLTGTHWRGPAADSMLAIAIPFATWLEATATQAEQSASHARAATAVFEQAYAMTVPPPVIAANRAQLTSLTTTNVLGQNAAAIAATETAYSEMWAQDAAAMHSYAAGSSAIAATSAPFAPMPQTMNTAALAAPRAAVAEEANNAAAASTAQLSQGLKGSAAPQSISLQTLAGSLGPAFSAVGALAPMAGMMPSSSGVSGGLGTGPAANVGSLSKALGAESASANGGSRMPGAATASFGRAPMVGQLSVPPAWASDAATPLKTLTGNGLTAPMGVEGTHAHMPGVPAVPGTPAERAGNMASRYGIRSTVVPRSPLAG